MLNQSIFIINSKILYDILKEVKHLFNFDINFINDKDLDKKKFQNYENLIFLALESEKVEKIKSINQSKVLILENLPIPLKKLIEKINILILKDSYQSQSEKIIKEYILNLNDRTIIKNNKKIRLTEKELKLILFLNSKNGPQNIINLQNEIWGYKSSLETHTVETHVYRLRKKIETEFKDMNFINSNKDGYFL